MTKAAKQIEIYTDGACIKNPGGPGGWGYVIKVGPSILMEASGRMDTTTSNRMEILAVALGLMSAKNLKLDNLIVYSDSQYVVNTITKNWNRNKNKDLWAVLDYAMEGMNVSLKWIKGHGGDTGNEHADRLANQAATKGRELQKMYYQTLKLFESNNVELPTVTSNE